jgi:hypothetical protein
MKTSATAILTESPSRISPARFVAFLLIVCFVPLFALAFLKFECEHWFAPKNMGIGGLLADDKTQLLLIGSSHTRQSYDVKKLEDETGVPAFLVAYNGMDLVAIDQIISYLIAQNRCPGHVVVEGYSALLAKKPDLEDPRLFFDSPPALKRTFLATYVAEHERPKAYFDAIDLAVSRGSESLLTYPVNRLLLQHLSYRGATEKVTPGVDPTDFVNFRIRDELSSSPNPHQLAALNHLVEITSARGIHIFFIDSPMPSPIVADSRIRALKADYRQLTRERNVPYIDGDAIFPNTDPALFMDTNHLSSAGRDLFTHMVADILRDWLSHTSAH